MSSATATDECVAAILANIDSSCKHYLRLTNVSREIASDEAHLRMQRMNS